MYEKKNRIPLLRKGALHLICQQQGQYDDGVIFGPKVSGKSETGAFGNVVGIFCNATCEEMPSNPLSIIVNSGSGSTTWFGGDDLINV